MRQQRIYCIVVLYSILIVINIYNDFSCIQRKHALQNESNSITLSQAQDSLVLSQYQQSSSQYELKIQEVEEEQLSSFTVSTDNVHYMCPVCGRVFSNYDSCHKHITMRKHDKNNNYCLFKDEGLPKCMTHDTYVSRRH